MGDFCNRIIKYCLFLLVFLLPLFFLPWSLSPFEFNKQYLLAILVSLAFFSWILKMVLIDKEIRFKKTPLDIFVAVFIFVAIISAIFSVDKGSSIFGFYGRFSDGLIGLISLAVLYFLVTSNVGLKPAVSVNGLLKVFLWSTFFVILISYFSIFGIWQKISALAMFDVAISLPQVMAQRSFNPVSGSMEGLSVFLAVISVLLVSLLSLGLNLKQVAYWILLLAVLGLLMVINFPAAWLVLLISLSLFLVLTFWQRLFPKRTKRLLLPTILIVIAGFFLVANLLGNSPGKFKGMAREPILSQGISWKIAAKTLTDDVKSGFLGSGIGTFFYDFSKQKPVEFNQTPLWQTRFDRSNNHISEILGTMGLLGFLSYLALVGMFLLISWILINTDKKRIPLLMGFLVLLLGQFVYYQNTTLAFMFWLFLALSVVSWERPFSEKIFSLRESPELNLVATVLLIIIGAGILGSYYFGQNIYRAEISYVKSQKMALGPERTALIEKAVKMNPNFAQYQTILARAYLDVALREVRKPVAEQDSLALQATVAKAIDAAKDATTKGPGQVATWETSAMIYRDIRLVASGATEWGIKSFEKAISLESTNPVLHTEMGKLLAIDNPGKARESFSKAIELKPDYLDARIQSALLYEKEDNPEEAIRKMGDLSLEYPFNPEILFQLGRLYFNAKRIDDAISQLEKVLGFLPNHSNALYSLGIAYKEKGEKEKAIKVFEKVLELNPGNQDVIQKLEELKK